MRRITLVASLLLFFTTTAWLQAANAPMAEDFLTAGKLADGERELANYLKEHPTDDEARFGLGTIQFVWSIEHLTQSLYQFGALGANSRARLRLPLLRLPVPENPRPEKVRYADMRRMLQNLIDDLAKSEVTLAKIKDQRVKLPLHFALIRLDVNGDGRATADELLWRMNAQINRGAGLGDEVTAQQAQQFVIGFDYGDVLWLRGYCHLLSAMCETVLMYDQHELFDVIAGEIFAKPEAPSLPLDMLKNDPWLGDIADAIAAIHMMKFPLLEPKRGPVVLEHLQAVIDLSRQTWKAYQAETDDDNEWVPNPQQTGVIPGVRVSKEMVEGWHEFLDEAEAILQGKKLVPHWRIREGVGVNVKQVFTEPREFDLVMWAHGAAALPYSKEGECTSQETWWRFQRVFQGEFIGFALWFN